MFLFQNTKVSWQATNKPTWNYSWEIENVNDRKCECCVVANIYFNYVDCSSLRAKTLKIR